MKTDAASKSHRKIAAAAACLAFGWLCWCAGSVARAQTSPANLSPALQEVVKLAQAHMSDDIITSYIRNSGASYSLSADDILYLNSQGVSQNVISVLQQTRLAAPAPAPAPAPATSISGLPPGYSYSESTTPVLPYPPLAPTAPAPAPSYAYPPTTAVEPYVAPVAPPGSDINLVYFQTQLKPYGRWVDAPPYGPVWQPNEALAVAGWRPYLNQGYWVNTDQGFYWHSDAPYGDIVFHYGRWLRDGRYGWVWTPGYDWAPAWVSWRNAGVYAGWAPLPPAATFEVGVGLMYRGGLALDVDFGLAPDDYLFVGYDHFLDHSYLPFLEPRERASIWFRDSVVMNDYRILDGRLVVEGLGRGRVALAMHLPALKVEKIQIRDSRIERGRQLEVTRTVARVKEIQARPATDPLRRTLDTRDEVRARMENARVPSSTDARGSGATTPSTGSDRGLPGARTTDPGRGTSGRDAGDSRDSREPAGGGSGGRGSGR